MYTVQKMRFSLKRRVFYICSIFLIFLLCLGLLFPKWPNSWRQNDIAHIVKSLIYWQNFSFDTVPLNPQNVSVPLTSELLSSLQLSQAGTYNNFLLYKMDNEKDNIENFDSIKQLETFLNFQPMMSLNERNLMLYTFHVFLEVCKKHNLTYMIAEGTLLGSYRHMGFIPWDDDLDVLMDVQEWSKIRDAFSGMPDFNLMLDSHYQWKIFPRGVRNDRGKSFKWPFLDIFFYDYDSTHLWGLTPAMKPEILFKKDDIFPLTQRPFENFLVNVPNNAEKVVNNLFETNRCVNVGYLHKRNMNAPSHLVKNVPCSYLYNLYPFVFRHQDVSTGETVEELRIGKKTLKEFRSNHKLRKSG